MPSLGAGVSPFFRLYIGPNADAAPNLIVAKPNKAGTSHAWDHDYVVELRDDSGNVQPMFRVTALEVDDINPTTRFAIQLA